MISCRYVGSDSSMLGDLEFDAVGEVATFTEQGFKEALCGGAAFLPEGDFSRLGLTPQELEAHGPMGLRCDPPASFVEKLSRGQQMYRDLAAAIKAGADVNTLVHCD